MYWLIYQLNKSIRISKVFHFCIKGHRWMIENKRQLITFQRNDFGLLLHELYPRVQRSILLTNFVNFFHVV